LRPKLAVLSRGTAAEGRPSLGLTRGPARWPAGGGRGHRRRSRGPRARAGAGLGGGPACVIRHTGSLAGLARIASLTIQCSADQRPPFTREIARCRSAGRLGQFAACWWTNGGEL